mmetsp:Transcript_36182/g.40399  ORF Transcript_36182/g.40399 Transcript_36182/m.40399 type:complete len:468 (+) Transcript_36182:203-1606(+)
MNMNTNNDAICYDLQKLSSEGEQLLVMDNNRTQSRDINDGSGGNCTENGRIDKVMSDDHHASLNVNVNPSPQQQQQQKGGIISDESSHGDNCDEETNNSAITSTAEGEREEQGDGNVQTIPGRLIESMTEIVKSPYEKNCCAEVNEDCFEKLKVLMEPIPDCDVGDPIDRINPKLEREQIFGDVLARILYKAYSEIKHSGILFSAYWKEGKIRNMNLGWIPKRQLLICLPEDRFAKADGSLLQAVIKNLDCFKLIIETMKRYKFWYDYPNLASNKNSKDKTFVFDAQKPRCFKCLIFVARGYAIMKNLGIAHAISSSLKKKFRACLHILNKHVQPNKPELARLKKEIETEARLKTATVVTPENKKRVAYNDTSSGSEANRTTTSNKKIQRQCNKEPPPESLFVSFNIIQEQIQRVNQMSDHLNDQFHGHRDGLMEAITDTIMNENANDTTGGDSDSDSDDTKKLQQE